MEKARRVDVGQISSRGRRKRTRRAKRERTGVVLLRQGSKRPGDRLVTRVFGHPDDFESILAPHARGCCDTRDLASAYRGAVFGKSEKKRLFFFGHAAISQKRKNLRHRKRV
jgi:hypothetical protein